jgi:hypothetical protein
LTRPYYKIPKKSRACAVHNYPEDFGEIFEGMGEKLAFFYDGTG